MTHAKGEWRVSNTVGEGIRVGNEEDEYAGCIINVDQSCLCNK